MICSAIVLLVNAFQMYEIQRDFHAGFDGNFQLGSTFFQFTFVFLIPIYFCSNLFSTLLFVQLFEGMKAYRGVDGKIRLFRPNMNMNRMNLSAKRSGLPTFDGDEYIRCISQLVSIDQEWVPHTEAASLYIRPTLIGIDVGYQKKCSLKMKKIQEKISKKPYRP